MFQKLKDFQAEPSWPCSPGLFLAIIIAVLALTIPAILLVSS